MKLFYKCKKCGQQFRTHEFYTIHYYMCKA
ncbi:hypothetical protein EXU29_18370 [Acinetobacter wuhouensis]|nr:hypothetical protein EXU29_18370 [Acinetobacter wuhouensis]